MEFKSQICTTREQSERLLALGLKKETADCALLPLTDKVTSVLVKPSTKDIKNTIPAWSLHRLLEIMRGESEGLLIRENEEIYNHAVTYIANMIKGNAINPKFLEDKNKQNFNYGKL